MRARKSRGGRIRGNLASLLVLILVAVVVFNRGAIYRQIKRIVGFGDLMLTQVKTVELTEDQEGVSTASVFRLQEALLSEAEGKLTLFDADGEARWQETVGFEDVLVQGNQNFFIVADRGKGNVLVYDYRGNVNASLYGETEIERAAVSPSGYIALLSMGSGEIMLYDPQLNHLCDLSSHVGDVLDIRFSETDNRIYVGTFAVEDGEISSYIYKYDLGGSLTGAIQMRDRVLLEYMVDGQSLVVVTDQDISTYSAEMDEIDRINTVGDIDRVAYADRHLYVQAYDHQSGLSDTTAEYDLVDYDLSKNEIVYTQPMESRLLGILAEEDMLIGYSNNEMFLLDDAGSVRQRFDLPREVQQLAALGDSRFLMTGTDYFSLIELRH